MSHDAWNSGNQSVVEARRWKAVTLQNRGLTLKQIAEAMQDEYRQHTPDLNLVQIENQVGVDIHRALKAYRARVDKGIEEKITQQELRFGELRRRLYAIISADHYILYQGEIVKDPEGNPLRDNGPVLAALAQLRALEDQEARLHGTYSSEKITLALERRVSEEATMTVEAILAGFAALPDLEPAQRQRALEAAGAHLRTIEGEIINEGPDEPA